MKLIKITRTKFNTNYFLSRILYFKYLSSGENLAGWTEFVFSSHLGHVFFNVYILQEEHFRSWKFNYPSPVFFDSSLWNLKTPPALLVSFSISSKTGFKVFSAVLKSAELIVILYFGAPK